MSSRHLIKVLCQWREKFCGVVVNVLNCYIISSESELRLRYYVHFRANTFNKGMKPLRPSAMGKTALLLSFYKDGFDIK